ncbi:MAG: hypothetical protein K1X55_17360, partial [Chitinophagales bacterium]|nr:hypothetical protein [Chitinophagales bacterium]
MKNLIIILFFPLICLGQSQTQVDAFKGTATGTNTYTVIINSVTSPTIYDGQKILVKFTNSNTAASTLKVNSYSAKAIEDQDGNALVSGAITAGAQLYLSYNSSFDSWQ